jgi:hypothetical protein
MRKLLPEFAFIAIIVTIVLVVSSLAFAVHPVVRCMPPIESDELRTIFADEWTLFYDSQTMPRVVQHAALRPLRIVHQSFQFNLNGNQTNPSNEFPWKVGGGLHNVNSREIAVVKFYWHPQHKPVQVFRGRRDNLYANVDTDPTVEWEFEVDSVLGEIIGFIRNGRTYPIEIRTLTREPDAWQSAVFRQHNTTWGLANEVWFVGHKELATLIGNTPKVMTQFVDPLHSPPSFRATLVEAKLPPLPNDIVDHLLNTPLREVLESSDLYSETSSIVPAKYRPSIVGIGREDCLNCHRHVANHVLALGWRGDGYGYQSGSAKITANNAVRGFGIFSFHPFDPASIGGRPKLNDRLIQSGHISGEIDD